MAVEVRIDVDASKAQRALKQLADDAKRAFDATADAARTSSDRMQNEFNESSDSATSSVRSFAETAADAFDRIAADAQAASSDAATAGVNAAQQLSDAYKTLGIRSAEELRGLANAAVDAFSEIASNGGESAMRLLTIWDSQVVPQITRAYGELPPAFRLIDDIVVAEAGQTSRELAQAFETFGVRTKAQLETLASNAAASFETLRASGELSSDRLADIWENQVVPRIIDAYGTLPAEFATLDQRIRASAEQLPRELAQAFERFGAQTESALQQTAQASVQAFERILNSGQASAQQLEAIWRTQVVPQITQAYGRLLPEHNRINNSLVSNSTTATTSISAGWRSTVVAIDSSINILERVGSVLNRVVQATTGYFTATATAVSETERFSRQLGISTQFLSELEVVAGREGIGVDQLRDSLRQATTNLIEAGNNAGNTAQAMRVLGINIFDVNGNIRSLESIFPALALGLANIQSGSLQAGLGYRVFGEQGQALVRVLGQGLPFFERSRLEAQALGISIGPQFAEQARTFTSRLSDAQFAVLGLGQRIVQGLLPAVNTLLPQFTAYIVELARSESVTKSAVSIFESLLISLAGIRTGLAFVQAGWSAVQIAANLANAGLLTVTGAILQAVQSTVSGLATLAQAAGLESLHASLDAARIELGVLVIQNNAVRDAAIETASEWTDSYNRAREAITASEAAQQKLTKSIKEAGDAQAAASIRATGSVQGTLGAINALEQSTQKAGTASARLLAAYDALGVGVQAALRSTASIALLNFNLIAKSGQESGDRIRQIFTGEVLPRITAAYQTFSQRIAALNKGIADDGVRRIATLEAAYEQLGIRSRASIQSSVTNSLQALSLLVQSGEITLSRFTEVYDREIAQPIREAFGRIVPAAETVFRQIPRVAQPAFAETARIAESSAQQGVQAVQTLPPAHAQAGQQIVQSTQAAYELVNGIYTNSAQQGTVTLLGLQESHKSTNVAIAANTQAAYELVNGVYTNSSAAGQQAINQYGEVFSSVLQRSTAAVDQETEKQRATIESYSAVSIQASKNVANAAVREFQISFASGRFTTEGLAKLWTEELVPSILDAYGRIPPHLQSLNERMVLASQEAAAKIQEAHRVAVTNTTSFYDALTNRIIERAAASTRTVTAIFAQGLQSISVLQPFGNTVEELTEQIGRVTTEIDNVRNSIGRGIPVDFITFQVERLQEVLFELIKRRDELLDQGQGSDELRRLLGVPPVQPPGGGSITTGPSGQATESTLLGSQSSGRTAEFQERLNDALRAAGVASVQEFQSTLARIIASFGGGVEGQRLTFDRFPGIEALFRLLNPPQPTFNSPSTTVFDTAPNPFLPPPLPPLGGGPRGGSFDGGPLDPNLDPLGIGAGGNARGVSRGLFAPNLNPSGLGAGSASSAGATARSATAVTFAAGSIVVNTQVRDANALAAELVPALNQQIRLGALRT